MWESQECQAVASFIWSFRGSQRMLIKHHDSSMLCCCCCCCSKMRRQSLDTMNQSSYIYLSRHWLMDGEEDMLLFLCSQSIPRISQQSNQHCNNNESGAWIYRYQLLQSIPYEVLAASFGGKVNESWNNDGGMCLWHVDLVGFSFIGCQLICQHTASFLCSQSFFFFLCDYLFFIQSNWLASTEGS